MTIRCLVVGVGKMGSAHLQALAALKPDALAGWAPSEKRREQVEAHGATFLHGNLDAAVAEFKPTHVIIASPVETLTSITRGLMAAGVRHLLVEKPVALSVEEGRQLQAEAAAKGVDIYVAYNRRFYASVRTALARIAAAGERIESVLFEFNEVVSPEGPTGHAPEVQARWLYANSLHVIDTALFPVGLPDPVRSSVVQSGTLPWHPAGSVFNGSGLTVKGVPFAYHSNWNGPGRWGLEWITLSARYVFRPLEKLAVMKKGSFSLEDVPLDGGELDTQYKAGVYLQNKAFLENDRDAGLVPLTEALELLAAGQRMAAYPSPAS